jgi:hypothetical protein
MMRIRRGGQVGGPGASSRAGRNHLESPEMFYGWYIMTRTI